MPSSDFTLVPVEKIERKKRSTKPKKDGKLTSTIDFTLSPVDKEKRRRRYSPMIKKSGFNEPIVYADEIKDIFHDMSASHFGSFCEYVISQELTAKGYEVIKSHGELKDLLVNNIRTDVKGHRHLSRDKSRRHVYPFKVPQTSYVHIVFLSDGAAYYDEDDRIVGNLSYPKLKGYWTTWPNDRKYRIANADSLKRRRNQVKKDFKNKLSKILGYPVYVVQRGSEITRGVRHFKKGPDNLSLDNIRHEEKLMGYIQFKGNSVVIERIVVFKVDDVKKGRFPMTLSWGRLDKINKENVVTEDMWDKKESYLDAYFSEETDLEETIRGIMNKFSEHSSG